MPVLRNPTVCTKVYNPERTPTVRYLTCRFYNVCLQVADDNKWPSFSCKQCNAFQDLDAEERRRDIEGIFHMLASSVNMENDVLDAEEAAKPKENIEVAEVSVACIDFDGEGSSNNYEIDDSAVEDEDAVERAESQDAEIAALVAMQEIDREADDGRRYRAVQSEHEEEVEDPRMTVPVQTSTVDVQMGLGNATVVLVGNADSPQSMVSSVDVEHRHGNGHNNGHVCIEGNEDGIWAVQLADKDASDDLGAIVPVQDVAAVELGANEYVPQGNANDASTGNGSGHSNGNGYAVLSAGNNVLLEGNAEGSSAGVQGKTNPVEITVSGAVEGNAEENTSVGKPSNGHGNGHAVLLEGDAEGEDSHAEPMAAALAVDDSDDACTDRRRSRRSRQCVVSEEDCIRLVDLDDEELRA